MIIYTRILDDNTFGGNFLEHQLQEGWNYTEQQPSPDLVSPLWDGNQWIEGATEEQILQALQPQINSIMKEYRGYIEELTLEHIIEREINETPIPQAVKTEYDRLISDRNTAIQAIMPPGTTILPKIPTYNKKK